MRRVDFGFSFSIGDMPGTYSRQWQGVPEDEIAELLYVELLRFLPGRMAPDEIGRHILRPIAAINAILQRRDIESLLSQTCARLAGLI